MSDAYVIEVGGRTAGIVARDSSKHCFNFFPPRAPLTSWKANGFPIRSRLSAWHGCLPKMAVCHAVKTRIPARKLRRAGLVRASPKDV
jgi:hypothetical protein